MAVSLSRRRRRSWSGFFFLDDVDKALVDKRRGDYNRLGFSLQLSTVRLLGAFLADPLDVPTEAVDFVAGQLGVADPSCLKAYGDREKTRLEHQWEIAREYGYRDFAAAEAELVRWVDDRAWNTGDGPKALFDGAVVWLRERRVLLPGVTTLARLVARVRDEAMQRLWDVLASMLTAEQARLVERLLEVPEGARVSDLERLRKAPRPPSGRNMVKALDRVAEVAGLGLGSLDLDAVPQRRVVELARWGMSGTATALRRHRYSRKLATMLATVVYLEAKATDDTLEMFDVLMTTELLARAERESALEEHRNGKSRVWHSGVGGHRVRVAAHTRGGRVCCRDAAKIGGTRAAYFDETARSNGLVKVGRGGQARFSSCRDVGMAS